MNVVFTDADNFEVAEPIEKAAEQDKWEGEDEEEDVKVDLCDKHLHNTNSICLEVTC